MMMTPISAHTLTSRSVVFPAGISLSVDSHDNPDEPLVSADGQPAFCFSGCLSLADLGFDSAPFPP